jgi:hypothetical protein
MPARARGLVVLPLWLLAACIDEPVYFGGAGGGGTGGGGSTTTATSTASTTSSGMTTTSTSSTGGSGGGSIDCGDLLPADTPCSDFVDVFDDLDVWDEHNETMPTDIQLVADGPGTAVSITLSTMQASTYLQTQPDITLTDCSIWVRLLDAVDDPIARSGLSFGLDNTAALYGIDTQDGELIARQGGANVIGTTSYDASSAAWLRIREHGGIVSYGYSADGLCWNEFASTQADGPRDARVRLVVQHASGGMGAAGTAIFDDLGVTP